MPSSRCSASGCCRSASFSGTVGASAVWLLISCRNLAIRALDGSAACVGVPLKKSAAQLPISPEKVVTTVSMPWLLRNGAVLALGSTPPKVARGHQYLFKKQSGK